MVAHAITGVLTLGSALVTAQAFELLDRQDRFQLTDAEVDALVGEVVEALGQQLGGTLRG